MHIWKFLGLGVQLDADTAGCAGCALGADSGGWETQSRPQELGASRWVAVRASSQAPSHRAAPSCLLCAVG